jgi:DNA-binding CsgD family transcriptional regulator
MASTKKKNEIITLNGDINLTVLEQLVYFIPGIVCWKNKEGEYLGCNETMAAILNLNSPDDIVGKTLYEIMPKKYAKPLLRNDHEVISANSEKIVEEVSFDIHGNETNYLARKVPLRNKEGGVIGLLALSLPIAEQEKIEKGLKLEQPVLSNDHKNTTTVGKLLETFDLKRYYLAGEYEGIYLTKREAQCINYLAKGNTAKQMGKILNLSPRTIEFYIENAKHKLNCHTQTELIAKAIECRFLNNVSSS